MNGGSLETLIRNYRYGIDTKVASMGLGTVIYLFHILFFYTLNYADINEPSNLCYVFTHRNGSNSLAPLKSLCSQRLGRKCSSTALYPILYHQKQITSPHLCALQWSLLSKNVTFVFHIRLHIQNLWEADVGIQLFLMSSLPSQEEN